MTIIEGQVADTLDIRANAHIGHIDATLEKVAVQAAQATGQRYIPQFGASIESKNPDVRHIARYRDRGQIGAFLERMIVNVAPGIGEEWRAVP